jgi:hypothetical protein
LSDSEAVEVPVKPVSKYEKIDYSSSYEPAPDIGFDNEFSKLGLITDMVKGLANQGTQSLSILFIMMYYCWQLRKIEVSMLGDVETLR